MTDDLALLRRAIRDVPACHIATVRPDGGPHAAVRWFVWLEDAIWLATPVGDTTWEHALRDPRVVPSSQARPGGATSLRARFGSPFQEARMFDAVEAGLGCSLDPDGRVAMRRRE